MARSDPASDPVLCDPYREPDLHWRLDERGRALPGSPLTGRRPSLVARFVPDDAKADPAGLQQEWDLGVAEHNRTVEEIRRKVGWWRGENYPGVTGVTRKLLFHWADEGQCLMPPFFAQREAIETLIWLREVATRQTPERRSIEEASRQWNDGIVRYAAKMATGSGKTAVMGMLIAWQTLNAVRTSRTRNLRHGQRFAVLTPGLTVRERLEVLKPSHPKNVYDEMGLVPPSLRSELGRAQVKTINFQAFVRRDNLGATGVARRVMGVDAEHGREDHLAAAERVLRELMRGAAYGDIVVINDEAHHCWLPSPKHRRSKDTESAAVWFNAIRALRDGGHLGREAAGGGQESVLYDFSATPMWIGTTARSKPRLFEWVVSDFPLMDAIESGLVKVPRVPIDDDARQDQTVWRNLYKTTALKTIDRSSLSEPMRGALLALYDDYRKTSRAWEEAKRSTPPVMIVVANSIRNAEALYEWIAGYSQRDGLLAEGNLPLLSNVAADGSWADHPRTLLVHSKIDQGEGLTGKMAGLAKDQVERYAAAAHDPVQAHRLRSMDPGEALRLMMNTVGKEGEPGERVRCVVSVSMLTEGWDVRTVTHVLGYRAFGTQLLCEQVTGRALRRSSYQSWREGENGRRLLAPEYADVVGIPFEFMPSSEPMQIVPPPEANTVMSLPGRQCRRVAFPSVEQYLRVPPRRRLRLDPEQVRPYTVQPDLFPTMTVLTGVSGQEKLISVSQESRSNSVRITLAARMVRSFVEDPDHPERKAVSRAGLFRDLYQAVGEWLNHSEISCPDPILLLRGDHYEKVSTAILGACRDSGTREREREIGSDDLGGFGDLTAKLGHQLWLDTGDVRFETTLQWIHPTSKSELNLAACHSNLELHCAKLLDNHPRVAAWARNYGLGWSVPYHFQGAWRSYHPDFVARLSDDTHLIIECKGMPDNKSEATKEYVTEWWIPAVAGTLSLPHRRWGFVELTRIPDMEQRLRRTIADLLRKGTP